MTKKALAIFIVSAAILLQPCASVAQSDWEFYFFGVNLKTFKVGNRIFEMDSNKEGEIILNDLPSLLLQ